jgi:DNA-binding IclR family transcriptional regulator
MLDNPDDTQAAWGEAIGRDKSRVNRKLQKLKELKLVEQRLGRWRLTPKGYEEASNA